MLQLKKLYSEPETFIPIEFSTGINLILGETSLENDKTNGVGKSMAIEFINYALLKKHSESRVSLIPSESFSSKTFICLDFSIRNQIITIKRNIEFPQNPQIIINGRSSTYSSIEDANDFLSNILFGSSYDESTPSFRSILGPLIRDEKSEFKSIIKCFDTDKDIPADYTPHLYLLSIDPQPYKHAKKLALEIDKFSTAIAKIKENIVTITNKNVAEAKADLNELTSQVDKIKQSIEELENIEGYDLIKNEIIRIETDLDKARAEQAVYKSELIKISFFSEDTYISKKEITELYNQFKTGLGDFIKKELDEVTAFKLKIDNFQRSLIDNKKNEIQSRLIELNKHISQLDLLYKNKLQVIDQKGALKNLKQTIASHQQKMEEQASLSAFITKLNDYEKDKKNKKRERDDDIYFLETLVSAAYETVKSVETTILDIHQYVVGNKLCSFDVEVNKNKEIMKFDLRIYDDGSHSNEREKVFMYDLALLINEDINLRHPGMLIHDNIFDVDQDTLIKSLNFIGENLNKFENKQYILTLNIDKIQLNQQSNLKLDLEKFKRAAFTKDNRFLRKTYQELSKKQLR